MTYIIDAPASLERRLSQYWRPDWRSLASGQPVEGDEQVVFSPGVKWRATLEIAVVGSARDSFAAFIDSLRGRQRAVRIRPRSKLSSSLYSRLGATAPDDCDTSTPFDDEAYFSDGSGFEWPAPEFLLEEAAAAFDDEVLLDMQGHTAGLLDGDWIGIGGRARRITRILDAVIEGQMRIGFEPPLTISLSAGATVTTRPTVVMRQTADDGGMLERGASRLSRPVLELVEIIGQT